MPTIPEMKAELKALGVKGITGKNKAELMAMLEQAKAPKVAPKAIPLKDILKKRKPEIGDLSEPPKEEPKKKPEIGNDGLAELLGIIAKAVAGPAPTTMKIINKGKKSQGEKKPSKEEIEDFVRSEIVRLDLPKKEAERPSQMGIKKASPPPRIPKSIKDTMTGKLAQEYDLHEYKIGLAHPIDDMIKWFKKVMNQDIWGKYISVATGFLTDLTKWVRENSHERPSWGDKDKTERVLLLSDWEDFFKANR